MATRFYLPLGAAAASEITSNLLPTGWAAPNEGTLNRMLARTPMLSTINGLAGTETSATVQNIAIHRCISSPLEAQSISGTFSAIQRVLESSTSADMSFQVGLYVISRDGSTTQATLYGGHTTALSATVGALGQEMGATSSTRIIPAGTAISTFSCAKGDRLMALVGYRAHNSVTTSFSATQRFGDNAGSDFALTAGLTTDLNPWIELSATLTFESSLLIPARGGLHGRQIRSHRKRAV